MPNRNAVARLFTSKKWQERLSKQEFHYEFITSDISQQQIGLTQSLQYIPNVSLIASDQSYYQMILKTKFTITEKQSTKTPDEKNQTGVPINGYYYYYIYQYKNAIYLAAYDHILTKDELETPGFLVRNKSKKAFDKADDKKTYIDDVKLFNLPYNSACFVDNTQIQPQNTNKAQKQQASFQQINRNIFRKQYDPTITQDYMNQNSYVYYGNNREQLLRIVKSNVGVDGQQTKTTIDFQYQVQIPLEKLFWLFQNPFIPAFKLKNQLETQIVFNQPVLDNFLNQEDTSNRLSWESNDITFSNVGLQLYTSKDPVMNAELDKELQGMEGIDLAITKDLVESENYNTTDTKYHKIDYGFSCLTNLELGFYLTTNQDYYNGYSTLFTNEESEIDSSSQQELFLAKQFLTFYDVQVYINNQSFFIGGNFNNSLSLYQTVNSRGLMGDQSNPYCFDQFNYFNKYNLRVEQFTDKYLQNVEPDEMNYSGLSVQKLSNNYINAYLADYNTGKAAIKYQTDDNSSWNYNLEVIYKYKVIMRITPAGDLTVVSQEYDL